MLAPKHDGHPRYKANDDAGGWTNPLIVEGVFQEVGDADQNRNNPDAIQPMSANFGFQLDFRIRPDSPCAAKIRGLIDVALGLLGSKRTSSPQAGDLLQFVNPLSQGSNQPLQFLILFVRRHKADYLATWEKFDLQASNTRKEIIEAVLRIPLFAVAYLVLSYKHCAAMKEIKRPTWHLSDKPTIQPLEAHDD